MTRRKKIILTAVIALIAVIALGGLSLYRFVDYGFESPSIAVFPSPDGNRSAYLIWHGALMGKTLTLLASPSNSAKDLLWLGSVNADDSLTFQVLVWSKDSNLVAARCHVGGYNKKLPEGVPDVLLTHGYDFAASRRLVSTEDVFDEPEGWRTRHEQLTQLFVKTGGELTPTLRNDLDAKMVRMKWFEWREWRRRITAAMQKVE